MRRAPSHHRAGRKSFSRGSSKKPLSHVGSSNPPSFLFWNEKYQLTLCPELWKLKVCCQSFLSVLIFCLFLLFWSAGHAGNDQDKMGCGDTLAATGVFLFRKSARSDLPSSNPSYVVGFSYGLEGVRFQGGGNICVYMCAKDDSLFFVVYFQIYEF